jgi:hypothetical protein
MCLVSPNSSGNRGDLGDFTLHRALCCCKQLNDTQPRYILLYLSYLLVEATAVEVETSW